MLQLILHAIGDYIFQNDWMALNKKKLTWVGELACQVHCVSYSLPFLWFYGWKVGLVVYVTHYLIDRSGFVLWFMRVSGKEEFSKPPMGPWGIIAVDNTFHVVCNFLAITYLQ